MLSTPPSQWQLTPTKPVAVISLAGNKGKMPAGTGMELEGRDEIFFWFTATPITHTCHSTTLLIEHSLPIGNSKFRSKDKKRQEGEEHVRHKNKGRS